MICFKLTKNEIDRIKWAADLKGFPWQASIGAAAQRGARIVVIDPRRTKTARRFLKRVEAEVARTQGRAVRPLAIGPAILAPA